MLDREVRAGPVEIGTPGVLGKELVARVLHFSDPNCAGVFPSMVFGMAIGKAECASVVMPDCGGVDPIALKGARCRIEDP